MKSKKNSQKLISFDLVTLPNAESQIYKVPIEISYNGTKKTSLISLEVNSKANIDVILDNTDLVKINDKGEVTLKFINNGLAHVKFLKVTLERNSQYDIISSNSIYVGEVNTDDFQSEEFTIIPRTQNPQLMFTLDYRDTNNNQFIENKIVSLNIYSQEEAQRLGLVKRSFNWLFIGLIILIVILIFLFRRMKKKNVN